MKHRTMIAALAVATVLVWIGVSAQQEMLPRPGPGSGVMDVRGTVSIANIPDVQVTNVPSVVVTGPEFLQKGGRYKVTWPTGEPELITVADVPHGGWIRVAHAGGARWINLSAALAVEQYR
jgi:hypothetical protein